MRTIAALVVLLPGSVVLGQTITIGALKIHDGKPDEFERLAAKCTELVRTKDTGTLQYELYLDPM